MNCNDHYSSMETNPYVGELNDALGPITILTDADLQNELDLYATTQFTFDDMPTNKPVTNHLPFQSSHPNLITDTNTHDPCSSSHSSPYDSQQHFFTPIPSLPTSPTLNDHQQMSLPFMVPGTLQQQNLVPEHDAHYMTRSASTGSVMNQDALLTMETHRPTTRRRGRPRRQQQDTWPASTQPAPMVPKDDATDTIDTNEVRLSKRQRNTAASARFRIKKKIREQCLQRTVCEMTNKANFMETKVHELEREITWLRALLVAKHGCGHC